VNERWYSDDLQMVVKSSNSDPRFGTTTYELTDINRAEPTRLCSSSSGYTLKEGNASSRPRRRSSKVSSIEVVALRGTILYLSRHKALRRWVETSPLARRVSSRFIAGKSWKTRWRRAGNCARMAPPRLSIIWVRT